MSGAASISAAKRRRSGGDGTNTQRGNNNTNNAPVQQHPPRTPQEILAIHDRLLPELIQRTNTNTTYVNEMRTLFSKIGENEKNLHNRLQKLEMLFNELADKTNNLGLSQKTTNNGETRATQEELERHKREALQKQSDLLEAHTIQNRNNSVKQEELHGRLIEQMHAHEQEKLLSQQQQLQLQKQFQDRATAMEAENKASKLMMQQQQSELDEARKALDDLRRQSEKLPSEPIQSKTETPKQDEDTRGTTRETTIPEESVEKDVQNELSSRKNNRNNKKNNKKNNVSLSIGDL